MQKHSNPRSVLHALEPIAQGTSEVESLLSYFCRLAVSHSTSTLVLSRTVAARMQHDISPTFDWYARQISGLRDSALTWSSALSALTTVPSLDNLTFLPWRHVVAQNGFAVATGGQFCPHCLAEDREQGRTPYFRLAWESVLVTVCHRHMTALRSACPCCDSENVRHASPFVIPGWCTRCGEFLGKDAGQSVPDHPLESGALWRARQIGELLGAQHRLPKQPCRSDLTAGISRIIAEMDGGQAATFARRLGIGKSTVHHWLKGPGTPTLEVSLNIAVLSGVSLTRLLSGDLENWQPPAPCQQLPLQLVHPPRPPRAPARQLDWAGIERELQAMLLQPTPIPVLEAAKRLGLEPRQLYLRANRATRQIGTRWLDYLRRQQAQKLEKAWPHLEAACRELKGLGKAVTRREIAKRVPAEILATVPRLLDVLKDVKRGMSKQT